MIFNYSKINTTRFFKSALLLFVFSTFLSSSTIYSQTTLVAGDIAIVGYNSESIVEDDFSFVLLRDITSGTNIKFTDFGWCSGVDITGFQSANPCGPSTGSYSDGAISWTSTSALPCGTQVRIQCKANLLASSGSIVGLVNNIATPTEWMSLINGGDQIFAFQGTLAAPTLITGISMNVNAGNAWEATLSQCTFNSNSLSTLPAALNATNSMAITPEVDNAIYNCVVSAESPTNLRTAIFNSANWTVNDATAFTLPIACTFSCSSCTSPTVPTVAATTPICAGGSSTLTITGTLNSATAWSIYSGSCGGTLVGTTAGTTFVVSPGSTTTYFVRGEGGCVIPGSCGSAMVNVTTCPELNVRNNADNADITDGSTTISIALNTDFGNVCVSGGTSGSTFRAENNGSGVLTFGADALAISNTTDFSITTDLTNNGTVAASGVQTFTIQFDPASAGTKTCTVTVRSNDADEDPYTFLIQGVGVELTVANPSSAAATQLLPFSRSFNASGGTAPYTFSTSSALPAGLTLSTSGLLHGTPAVSGTFPIVVSSTDANGCSGIGSTYNLVISAGTIGVARWVNPSGGTPPAQVVVNCNTYNTAGGAYTTIQSAINAAVNGDVVYITDGTYANPSVVANCITGGVSAQNYLVVSGKTNLIITSATGSYCNSAAVLTGYGFRIATGNNITIQGLELQNVPVNAFYNSNAGTQTSNVTIKNNYVLGTYGHGIKTDDHPSDGAIDRSVWEITGNKFENIGSYNPGSCTLGPVSAIWLAQAGYHFNIFDNTIINTRWAGILCVGQGGNNNWDFPSVGTVVSPGLLTVSGNRIDQTLNAGIQIGFSAGAFYYSNGANITHNKITNANTGNFAGIGGITMLQTNILGVSITYNDVSASNNALAIDITGWQESFDTRTITNNNFYSLTGGHGVTHIAGIAPNTLGGLADNLNNYNFRNNYWGAASGPTYSTNPGGTGVGLLKETTLRGTSPTPAGIVYSLNDFIYSPFRTTPVTVNSVVACSMLSLSTTKVDVLCNGNSTGTIDLMVTGGSIPYTYNWNTGQTSQDRSGLAAGTYTVTVTDASCSTSSVSVTITQPGAILLTETNVDVLCNGAATGTIDLMVSGGTGGYMYSWTGGATTQDRSGLAAGTYTVTVTDANGCTKTTSATITQPSAIVLTETNVDVLCNGAATGTIDLMVSGGTGGYMYSWTGGATTQDRSGLAAGTYTVTVTDANICTKTTSATITEPVLLAATATPTNVICNSDGTITLTITGGISPYDITWDGPAANDGTANNQASGYMISSLPAGTYAISVTDDNGCIKTASATITEPAAMVLSTTTTPSCTGGATGIIDLTVLGGTMSYTYLWTNGAISQDISGLAGGTYTVTVTDSNGCSKTTSAVVSQSTAMILTTTTVATCVGGNIGSIDLTVSGGTPTYSYLWSNTSTAQDINGLGVGTYTVIVTDMNNCTATTSASITTLPLPCGWTAETNGVGCNTGNNFTYNFTSKVFTATSSNCYYPNSFTSDALAFAQYDLCGNGSITAQVTSITPLGLGWAGVTMRESNAAGAKKAQLMTNLGAFSRREFRTTTGAAAYPQQFPSQNRYWLRITRTGNQFTMYISQNGTSWSFSGTQTIVMGNCIEVGLVVTNYTANSTVIANFANVSVTGGNITKPTINTQEDLLTAADFTIMPNPTTGIISLDLGSYGKRQVQLDMYNLQGKLLRSTNVEASKVKEEMDLSAFANGMYLIRVRAEGLPDVTKRVVLNSNQ